MSPCIICFTSSVCNVATWPYLKIVETGLGFILLWSMKFCVSSCKKTESKIIMDFFQNYHKVKHTCICNVAMDHSQVKPDMQCRHLSLAFWTEYAMSPPAACGPIRVCNVAFYLLHACCYKCKRKPCWEGASQPSLGVGFFIACLSVFFNGRWYAMSPCDPRHLNPSQSDPITMPS